MIDPEIIADSIIMREAMTFRLARHDYTPAACESLKLRLVKELRQAARHAVADLLEAANEAEEFLCSASFADRGEAEKGNEVRQRLATAIAKAEALS